MLPLLEWRKLVLSEGLEAGTLVLPDFRLNQEHRLFQVLSPCFSAGTFLVLQFAGSSSHDPACPAPLLGHWEALSGCFSQATKCSTILRPDKCCSCSLSVVFFLFVP